MDQIAVLIPCYNEEVTIGHVVESFRASLPEAVIYVYDNNSTDKTQEAAEAAGAIVRHEYQQGKGNVVRRMFQDVNAKCYILVDGDDTYPAESARSMTDLVLHKNADMVIGDRLSSTYFKENKRRFHNFGNSMVRFFINHIFHSDIRDIMTGYRAFSYRFVKTFPILSKGFEIETEMTIHAISMNMSIENVVVQYRDRPQGSESKLSTISDGAKVLATVFNLYRQYHPLPFFAVLAFLLVVISAAFFIPCVLIPYSRTGLVENFPTLIVCGFIIVAAILSFFNGMILDAIRLKERRDFEFHLALISTVLKHEEEDPRN